MNRSPFPIVVSAPSGAGKTTVCRTVTGRDPGLVYSVSATTRLRRPGERNGRDYFFLTPAQFNRRLVRGQFLEHARVFGWTYGTPKAPLLAAFRAGRDVILDLDHAGSRALQKIFPDCLTIFLAPPSVKAVRQRLSRRGTDSAAEISKRLAQFEKEMAAMYSYHYVVVNNKLEVAVRDILSIIHAERLKPGRWI